MQKSQPNTRIQTFGTLQIQQAGELLPLKGEKARSLLAYLILHPRLAHRRELVADMLWHDAQPERVRQNLSDLLYRIQKEGKIDWLQIEPEILAIQPNEDLWVDVWEYDRLITSATIEDLRKAVELYAGELLPEIYEDWVIAERELRRGQYISALETLSKQYEGEGKLQDALQIARKLILTEPLHEPAHQVYLRLLGRLKRFGEAFTHYDYFCALLRSELDSKPIAETEAIIIALAHEQDLEDAPLMVEETRPFIGRKAERAAALAAVEEMLNGKGSILMVEGEAGIGKSRFVREIVMGARWRGATVFQGQTRETPDASPFLPLIEAFKPLFNSQSGKEIEGLFVREALAALAPLNPAWGKELHPEPDGKRFHNVLRLFGEALAKLTPTMLVVEDLHWADAVLWESLRSFAVGFIGQGGLLIISIRHQDKDQLQAWKRDGNLKSILLKPFNTNEVSQLIGESESIAPADVFAWSGGNPFFIMEWLAKPELKRPSHQNAISLRLQTLSPIAKSALEHASVLGEMFSYQLWADVTRIPTLVLADIGDELTARQWLQPSAQGYSFTHELIRTAVYAGIESARRREMHARAAQAYLTLEPENARARAHHLDQAGLVPDAAKAYRLAGEQDMSRFAFREAQKALERALSLTPDTQGIECVELCLALARVANLTGDRERQESALKEALTYSQNSNPHALQALLLSGRFLAQTGRHAEAGKQLESALALAKKLKDRMRETDAVLTLADLSREQSHWVEAKKHYEKALKLARTHLNKVHEARALKGIGYIFSDQGRPKDAIVWFERAVKIDRASGDDWKIAHTQTGLLSPFMESSAWDRLLATAAEVIPVLEAFGDRPNLAVARHNQALAYRALGESEKARQALEENLQVFESFRSRRAMGTTQAVLGSIAENEGRHQEAITLYRRSLENAEAVKSLDGIANAQWYLGSLLLNLEQPLDAIPLLETALDSWLEQKNEWERKQTGAVLGQALLTVGEKDRAEEFASNGWEAFQSGEPLGENPQRWLWSLYRLLQGLNQTDRAHKVLQGAYDELQRQGKSITNPDMRRGFFERNPQNRAILNAYSQLVDAPRVISVSLARKDVPLGRALRKDEFVLVRWTVNTPEDESIVDKIQRRQHRLKRLLAESAAQGAAPTDDDLAQALEVSRRTILRDMQELAADQTQPATRKRKK